MARIWVYSPVSVINTALVEHLAKHGFSAYCDPSRADAAVVDLSPLHAPTLPPPTVPTVALLGTSDPNVLLDALRVGYRGVLRPADDWQSLARALGVVLKGGTWAPKNLPEVPEVEAAPAELTPREIQVLSLLMLGLPNKRIAVRLELSERTVKYHVTALMKKFRTKDRVGLLLLHRVPAAA